MKKAVVLGIASSFFFAFAFILNRNMNLSGGYWIWSASLRYFFVFPIIALLVKKRYGFQNIHMAINKELKKWLIWSTVAFGLFYAPLAFAADYGAAWLIAASWQITIVMGVLLAPLFGKKIPFKNLFASGIILFGVFLLQVHNLRDLKIHTIVVTLLPILIAAISYPLGNRKMMAICNDQVSTTERVYGMTLSSLPFWFVLSVFGFIRAGLPSGFQVAQSFIVALFAGIIATLLFFKATDKVKSNQKWLAVIESTQSGEIIFTLLGGILFLGDSVPDIIGFIGIALIIFGMILNSIVSSIEKRKQP